MTINKIFNHFQNSFGMTRRTFLASAFIGFLSCLIKPFNYAHSTEKYAVVSGSLIKGEFKFFTPYQATLVEDVTSLIIPADELPGAKETGVVFEIDHILSDSKNMAVLYVAGLEWLDYFAWGKYKKKSFLDLTHDEKIAIIKVADSGKLPDMYDNSPRIKSTSEGIKIFFEVIKQQTFEAFYTSQSGWEVAGYQGPPQWSGNRDYHHCS